MSEHSEQFEEWAEKAGYATQRTFSGYVSPMTQCAWLAWKASGIAMQEEIAILRDENTTLRNGLLIQTDQVAHQEAVITEIETENDMLHSELARRWESLNVQDGVIDGLREEIVAHKSARNTIIESIDKRNLVVVNEDDANLWYSGVSLKVDWPEGFHCEDPISAELDRLRAEDEAADVLIARQRDLLTGVASALKGPPEELSTHSHHDLPEIAATLHSDLAAARDEIAALRAIARSAAQEEETKLDENQFITQQSRIVKLAALREAGYLKEEG